MNGSEQQILVFQGGGALGAYQAGAYQSLAEARLDPDWVAGISIGAINAALICGNPPEQRLNALHGFWDQVTAGIGTSFWPTGPKSRELYGDMAATRVMMTGVPGFFRPRTPLAFAPFQPHPALGVYDTSPLHDTLCALVDFDYLNTDGPRLSIGAVDIETANFEYFDSMQTRIGPEHIMASGALPPGFPPVEIGGRFYWDGGLVSNTPLQYVMDNLGPDPACIFQVDLFNARGGLPETLLDVGQRQKDIQYSSRTRLTTDRYRQLHDIRLAAARLAAKLPEALRDDEDLAALQGIGPDCPVTLVELIHRKQFFENSAKDYEFSALSMTQHWQEGADDVARTLGHPDWTGRDPAHQGLRVFDLGDPRNNKETHR